MGGANLVTDNSILKQVVCLCNFYFNLCPRRLLLDTGEKGNLEYLSNLSSVLKENNIHLGFIVISHWHSDHIGGLRGVLDLDAGSFYNIFHYYLKFLHLIKYIHV